MKLRPRLALTVAAAAVPLVAGLFWLAADIDRRASEQALLEYIHARMDAGGREQCEASPETFPDRSGPPPWERGPDPRGPGPGGGPGPGPPPGEPGPRGFGRNEGNPRPPRRPQGPPRGELWAYDPTFSSANLRAPPFPRDLRERLEHGARTAGVRRRIEEPLPGAGGTLLEVAARMDWAEGPCAIILARRFEPPPPPGADAMLPGAIALCAGLLLVVVAAAGPVVRRIRRLTGDVRRSAADRYATPVEAHGSDEIAELAQAFNEAGAELRAHVAALEERERTLRAFVANTTHDIATPLTVLQGHLAALRKRIDGGEGGAEVAGALEEAHYMASLLHNLGAAAKLEAAPAIERHAVDLARLVERVVARHRPIAAQRSVSLEHAVPERPLAAEGDEVLLEQALSNVVQNAVRYNDAGGHVVVVLEERAGGERFSLRVADDGPGVPDDQLARLGERSFRGDAARTRHPGGLGLGLHIARDVAARHGFSLEISKNAPRGLAVEVAGPALRGIPSTSG